MTKINTLVTIVDKQTLLTLSTYAILVNLQIESSKGYLKFSNETSPWNCLIGRLGT